MDLDEGLAWSVGIWASARKPGCSLASSPVILDQESCLNKISQEIEKVILKLIKREAFSNPFVLPGLKTGRSFLKNKNM